MGGLFPPGGLTIRRGQETTKCAPRTCSHLRMTDVSRPPEYASTTFLTWPDAPAARTAGIARATGAACRAAEGRTDRPRKKARAPATRGVARSAGALTTDIPHDVIAIDAIASLEGMAERKKEGLRKGLFEEGPSRHGPNNLSLKNPN